MKWNYISTEKSSNGYEDVLDTLKSYTKENYLNATEEDKVKMVNEVFNIYRSKNIFPITYYNEQGIIDEIQKCIDKDIVWDSNVLDFKFNQGQSLCRFLFPNLFSVVCKGSVDYTLHNKFYNDHKLKRGIDFCLKHKTTTSPCVPTAIKDGLEMLGGNGVATNFKAMNAKALYERYCPVNGIIYDFSCGFGGRMLGALSSKNNYKYFGVEPCTETFDNLNVFGGYIEQATNTKNRFKIFCKGSEDYKPKNGNFADFAFSSPPYFNLEKYSDEETQCYNKFNTLEEWFEGYVKPTIENIYHILKPNSYYAVNIADFKVGNKKIEYVDRWIEISKNCGFEYIENISMKLNTRVGDGHKKNEKAILKQEGIFVFRKSVDSI